MSELRFSFGDRVIHAGRPEWGAGTVTAAAPAQHDGKACQRLTIRFERAGLKTLSTGAAELLPADAPDAKGPAAEAAAAEPQGWLASLEAGDVAERMARLPDEVRDPFSSLEDRVKATFALYRFSEQGGPLLDWASAQTSLKDPLTRFSRHELEEHFRRYAIERDDHLVTLMVEAKRKDQALLARIMKSLPAGARHALRKFNTGR